MGAGDAGIWCCNSSGRMTASATALFVALINLLASNGVLAQQVGNLTCEKSVIPDAACRSGGWRCMHTKPAEHLCACV